MAKIDTLHDHIMQCGKAEVGDWKQQKVRVALAILETTIICKKLYFDKHANH